MDTIKNKIYEFIDSGEHKSMKLREIQEGLNINKGDINVVEEALKLLVNEGKVIENKKSKYMTIKQAGLVCGTFQGNEKGFGFVILEDKEYDIFIPARFINGAINMDKVLCRIVKDEKEGKSCEGEIISVIDRAKQKIVGTYSESKSFGFVVPDDKRMNADIYIPKSKKNGAVDGHKVVARITSWLEDRKNPDGEILEVIGHKDDPGVDIMSIIIENGIRLDFPKKVMQEIKSIPDEVNCKEYENRLDLRNVEMITIDGEDAKDLDDAVSISKLENGNYKLGVHIADVTNYVKEGSPLDTEALKRSTSVYLVDRVIPMLPHKLSNGICSLNAGVDRLALSCIMEIDNKGVVVDYTIAETILNIDKRMSYTEVQYILDNRNKDDNNKLQKEYGTLLNMCYDMEELADILEKHRKKRGSLDFESEESKIILNEEGKPIEIKKYERTKSTKIIESFMLVANETVAEDYFWQELPFVYRSHENPDPEKIEDLSKFLSGFGYVLKLRDETHSKELQEILKQAVGKPEERVISKLMLRSMKQARYTPHCEGHFGLAAKYYCHFTSPIRRYPDLQIHRIIKENLTKGISDKRVKILKRKTEEVSKIASIQERVAEQAERDTDDLKKCEYMKEHIGESFEGRVSGVTSWGMFIELPNTVEGLVRVTDIEGDYYIFDDKNYMLIGEKTKKQYRIGDKVKVNLVRVSVEAREIDFILSNE